MARIDQATALRETLARLYEEQLAVTPSDYIRYHSSPQAIASRVNSFLVYQAYLPTNGRVLDWGCQHAPDATMVQSLNNGLELIGCDFLEPMAYEKFWKQANMRFVVLDHHVTLPFDTESFDCVIGGGVLEHVAMDYELLKELFRIIKPGGRLIITHLPNWLSYSECLARIQRKADFHRRLYSPAGISAMLKHTGFYPLKIQRHRFLPTNSLRSITKHLSAYELEIDRLWPLSLFSGDIIAIAERVRFM